MQQQKISLLVSSSRSAIAAEGEEVPSGGTIFHYNKQSGFNVITWSNHGLTYARVSSLPGSGRQSCSVCHQSMRMAHTSALIDKRVKLKEIIATPLTNDRDLPSSKES
jgi:hypothetical protein